MLARGCGDDARNVPSGLVRGRALFNLYEIEPTHNDDAALAELGRFLTAGFGAPVDSPFASIDVLRWKHFDPIPASDAPRSYVARKNGVVVGHLGLARGAFFGPELPPEGVETLHMIDWLGSKNAPGVGASLLLRTHRGIPTQYGLGGSRDGRGVGGAFGYTLVGEVPVYQRILRPTRWLRNRDSGLTWPGRAARTARDIATLLTHRPQKPSRRLDLVRVETFDDRDADAFKSLTTASIVNDRRAEALNHFLRHPRGWIHGYRLGTPDGSIRGSALISLVERRDGARVGKLLDWAFEVGDIALEHAAVDALTHRLADLRADVVTAFASTSRQAQVLCLAGFTTLHPLEFRLRDKGGLLPRDLPFHLTALDADYAALE